MFIRKTYTPSDGKSILQAKIERWQKSDGSWKEMTTNYDKDGNIAETYNKYAINGRGLFGVNEKKKQLQFLSSRPDVIPAFSEETFRKNPRFGGESALLGYKTLIERIDEGDGELTEFHRAPELNGFIVKIFSTSADGSKTVIEATDIIIAEFSDSEYGVMPEYPVVYDSYKKAVDATKDSNPNTAKEMEKNLPK